MKKLSLLILTAMVLTACNIHDVSLSPERDMGRIEAIHPVYGSDGEFRDLRLSLTHDTILVELREAQMLQSDTAWNSAFKRKGYPLIDDGYGNARIEGSRETLRFRKVRVIEVRE